MSQIWRGRSPKDRAGAGPRRDRPPASAADGGHGPVGLDEVRVADAVTAALAPHLAAHQAEQLVVGGALAQRATQVGLGRREEAVAHLPVRREARAVTGSTERCADAGDDADRL